MTRRGVGSLALVLALTAAASAGTGNAARPGRGPHGTPTMAGMAAIWGDSFDLPAPPAGQTPEQRASWILSERQVLGRAPMDWVRWSQDVFALRTLADPTIPRADLATEVLRLYGVMGLPVSGADLLEISASAAAVPAGVRAAFADLVGVVADAYAAQLPIASVIAARWAAGLDPHTPIVRPAERDRMAAAQAGILDAINLFRARIAGAFAAVPHGAGAAADPPLFSDPEGLVVLGGTGNGLYTRSGLFPDPVLLVEPAGSDRYENSAGGACPLTVPNFFFGQWMQCNQLAVSVVADLGDATTGSSDDVYHYDGVPSAVQGAGGPGGIGVLVDVGGNDQYLATMTRDDIPPFQPFVQYFDGGGQGFGYAGSGLLLDGVGDDVYEFNVNSTAGESIWALAQGFGGAGGLGISSDGAGSDDWLTNGLGLTGDGFEGLYADGVGFYGGVGIMTDTGMGNDNYISILTGQTVDYYSIGFGAFGGLGILYEDGGSDYYYTSQTGTDPFIDPLLNCAFGTASFGGVGVMVDVAGDDYYYGESVSPYGASVMDSGFGGPGVAYGLFVDAGGTDHYEMVATGSSSMIMGRGLYEPDLFGGFDSPLGHNTFGTFVDIGGTDTYIGGPGANDSQWPFGVDRGV